MSIKPNILLFCGALLLASCNNAPGNVSAAAPDKSVASSAFPKAQRPVSAITSDRWATEAERDSVDEANKVIGVISMHDLIQAGVN